jgi:arylsulfatase A-like enzyme
LNEYGVLRNTIVVFTSDHGELMGDHHYFRKALPYEGSAKVPFIVNDPTGRFGFATGAEVEQVIELRDIMPTLLDAAGAQIPASVEGRSLLPLCGGHPVTWRDYIHGEHTFGKLSNHFATDGNEKYIWFSESGEEQFFDLSADPQEKVNLAANPAYASKLADWRGKVVRELDGREEGYVKDGRLVAGRKPRSCLSHILP